MKYRDLLNFLKGLTDDQLENDVTVYDYWDDIYHPISEVGIAEDDGILYYPHVVLTFNTGD